MTKIIFCVILKITAFCHSFYDRNPCLKFLEERPPKFEKGESSSKTMSKFKIKAEYRPDGDPIRNLALRALAISNGTGSGNVDNIYVTTKI